MTPEEIKKYLLDKKNAEIIHLSYEGIDDEGVKFVAEFLKTNSSVTKLYLGSNKIGAEGAKSIGEALKINCSVIQLDLGSNKIGAEGAKSIGEALKTNSSVTKLDLGSNKIGAEGAKSIGEALKINCSVTQLYLGSNKIGNDGAKFIGEALKTNSSVAELYLYCNEIGTEGAQRLADGLKINHSLKNLHLNINKIGAEGAKSIGEALKTNSSVTKLVLRSNEIGAEGAKSIGDGLKANSSLSRLDLDHNKIGAEGAKSIGEALKINCSVTQLYLGSNKIGNDGAKFIGEALKTNSSVAELYLYCNEIGAEGAKSIGEALKTNSSVTKLDLRSNKIGAEGAKSIGDSLKTNSSLAELYLSNHSYLNSNKIGAEGAKSIGEALKINCSVTQLDLGSNKIGAEGAKSIGEALKTNSSVTKLDLGSNEIGAEGAKSIGDALKANSSLSRLDLDHNEIGAEGAKFIVEVLKSNTFLTILELSGNKIGADLKKELSAYVSENRDWPRSAFARMIGNYLIDKVVLKKEISKELNERFITNYKKICFVDSYSKFDDITLLDQMIDKIYSGLTQNEKENSKVVLPDNVKNYCKFLLIDPSYEKLQEVLDIIVQASLNSNECIHVNKENNAFKGNFAKIANWLPEHITYQNLVGSAEHSLNERFLQIKQLDKLLDAVSNLDSADDHQSLINIAIKILDVFEDFVTDNNQEHQQNGKELMLKYGYILAQQQEYCKLFALLSDSDPVFNASDVKNKLIQCKQNFESSFKDLIVNLELKDNMDSFEYYKEAIDYLDKYKDNENCIKNLAKAYKGLGDTRVKDSQDSEAISCYVKSLEYNKDPLIYNIIGKLMQKACKYEDAVKFFQVTDNTIAIKECFKELIKANPDNYAIRELRGDVFAKLGDFHKAFKCYLNANSLTYDEKATKSLLIKIADCQKSDAKINKAQEYIDRANQEQLYHFDLVNLDDYSNFVIGDTDTPDHEFSQ